MDLSIDRQRDFLRTARASPVRAEWKESFSRSAVQVLPDSGEAPIELEVIGRTVTVIYRLKHEGKTYYFRPAVEEHPLLTTKKDMITMTRLLFLASEFNKEMGLSTCAESVQAIVNGMPGVLSEGVAGVSPKSWQGMVAGTDASDMVAFEFVIGTYDLHNGNVKFDGTSVKTFDYDEAFINGLPIPVPHFYDINTALPESYSKHFISALSDLNREKIVKRFGSLMTRDEIEGVLFRREVILSDVSLRMNVRE